MADDNEKQRELLDSTMSLGDHLEELRARILLALVGLVLGTIVALIFGRYILAFIKLPYDKLSPDSPLVVLGVPDAFIAYFKVSVIAGLLLTCPWVFYQLWAFVASGLYKRERKYVYTSLPFSVVLFITGAMFFLLVVAPISLGFFLRFGEWIGVESLWTLQKYVSFITVLMLVFGLGFQTPIAIFVLNRTGLVSITALKASRRYVFLSMFVIAAIATPPDVISQITLAIPLYVLFEMGILISWMSERKRKIAAGGDGDGGGSGSGGGGGGGSPSTDTGGGGGGSSASVDVAEDASAMRPGGEEDWASDTYTDDGEYTEGQKQTDVAPDVDDKGHGYADDDPCGGDGGAYDHGDSDDDGKSHGEQLYGEENAYVDPGASTEAEKDTSDDTDPASSDGYQDPYGPGGEYWYDGSQDGEHDDEKHDYGDGDPARSDSYSEEAARSDAQKEIDQAAADSEASKAEDSTAEAPQNDPYPEPAYEGEPESPAEPATTEDDEPTKPDEDSDERASDDQGSPEEKKKPTGESEAGTEDFDDVGFD